MTASEFNNCVDLYADNLYRFILKNVRDPDAAKDIVQDTFEKIWMKVNDVESTNAKSYLFTTGYRTMIDYLRRTSKLVAMTDEADVKTNDFNAYNGLKEILNAAIERLPAQQRSALMLRDYEGYDYREIAAITGLSESQVKVYIFRARQFLKGYIGKIEVLI
jgi:RNA polymerase sigma factor (sigma-70 family)